MDKETPTTADAWDYAIRVGGHLDDRWSVWLEGLELLQEPDGTTLVRCGAIDQAALHGVLRQIRDAGLHLISVSRVATELPQPTE